MLGAGEVFGEIDILRFVHQVNGDIPFSKLKRRLDGVGDARPRRFLFLFLSRVGDHDAVYHGFNRMLLVAVEVDLVVEAIDLSVYAGAGETGLADLLEDGLVRPFAGAHQR